jgi:hypothetical protein
MASTSAVRPDAKSKDCSSATYPRCLDESRNNGTERVLLLTNAKYNQNLSTECAQSFVDRHNAEIKEMTGEFPGPDRLVIPEPFLQMHISTTKNLLAGKIAGLVFDLNEVSAENSEDHGEVR